jgi:hypothetical protein
MKAAVANPARTGRTGSPPSRRSSIGIRKPQFHRHPCICWRAEGITMDCSICKDLEKALESRRSEYLEACSAAYYRVSTELAAHKNVDMERAKGDLEEHRLVCLFPDQRNPELFAEDERLIEYLQNRYLAGKDWAKIA